MRVEDTISEQIEELSNEDDDGDQYDVTEEKSSYFTLIRSERKKSIQEAFSRLKGVDANKHKSLSS